MLFSSIFGKRGSSSVSNPLTKKHTKDRAYALRAAIEPMEGRILLSSGTIYNVIGLNPLSGGSASYAYGINSLGKVVGFSIDEDSGNQIATLWNNSSTPSALGVLTGGSNSEAYGINNAGVIVGESDTTSGNNHAFQYSSGVMSDLGTLGGNNSVAYAINTSGTVVGESDTESGTDAFRYASPTMTDLGTMGGVFSNAYAINASGQIVGSFQDSSGNNHAFQDTGGTITDLGFLTGGSNATAYGINATGEVVGAADVSDSTSHAFAYAGNSLTDLGTLGGADSGAYGINSAGTIVGYADVSGNVQHAFIDSGGVMTDLNSLISPTSGWVLNQAKAINDAGMIVGFGTYNGNTEAFELTLGAAPANDISGRVLSGSGKHQIEYSGNSKMRGVTVSITALSGTDAGQTATTVSNQHGAFYYFTNLPDGRYKVSVTAPSGYKTISPASGSYTIRVRGGTYSQNNTFILKKS